MNETYHFFYKIVGRDVIPCSLEEYIEQDNEFNKNKRVATTSRIDARVSTVFLGMNHRFAPGPPILFETLVFGGPSDNLVERYCTLDEAEAGHERWCQKVFGNKKTPGDSGG